MPLCEATTRSPPCRTHSPTSASPTARATASVLAPGWHPDQATEFNGAVWPCLGSAVWALRTTGSYEDAPRAAIDLGGDTDTVAAVTGGLAGGVHGVGAIPEHWIRELHVPLPGFGGRVLRVDELRALAEELACTAVGPC